MTRTLKGLLAALLLTLSCAAASAQEWGGDVVNARQLIARGNERYARGDYRAAIETYVRVPPGAGEAYAQALYNIGVCRFELWQTEEAAGAYRHAVEARGGRYPKASYALGVALEEMGRAVEAKEAYALAAASAYAPAHYKLGMLAARAGDDAGAAAHLREAIKRSKERFPASHNNLGVVLARAGRLAEAEREFEAALRESDAPFEEAEHNLKLCRRLLAGNVRDGVAALKVAASADGFSR
jgi:tetratricopeptide (TPR) repeat protein